MSSQLFHVVAGILEQLQFLDRTCEIENHMETGVYL